MLWAFTIVGTLLAPISSYALSSKFSCEGRETGYYADVSTGCQVYHMCDGLGRQFTYTCPNATLFQQRMLICDHWYMVNCSRAEGDYGANLLIGQKKPFVEDSTYDRTPRPDLLTVSRNKDEQSIIYRTKANQDLTPKNVVGLESEYESSTDEPTYFPPSHWSTSYAPQQSTTTHPRRIDANRNVDLNPRIGSNSRDIRPKAKAVNFNSVNRNGNILVSSKQVAEQKPKVNFDSNFKATTPVYPVTVKDTTNSANDIGLLPPIPYINSKFDSSLSSSIQQQPKQPQEGPTINFQSNFKATTPVYPSREDLEKLSSQTDNSPSESLKPIAVNFNSNFKATTPVYPNSVESTSPNPVDVGIQPPKENSSFVVFKSNFTATTPVYPNSVEATSPDPNNAGLLPPAQKVNQIVQKNFESNYKATTPVYPNSVEATSPDPNEAGLRAPLKKDIQVNFESKFKATTPVYPLSVEATSPNPNDVGLIAPKETNDQSVQVNFESNFKATTPVYPSSVESTSPDPVNVGLVVPREKIQVNFQSNFKATTPVYPTNINPVNSDPLPQSENDKASGLSQGFEPPKFDENYKANRDPNIQTTSAPPSKFYQAPKFEPDFTLEEDIMENEIPGVKILNFMKSFNNTQWQDIRKALSIPEYDFPLDDATRPSYDSIVNSFAVRRSRNRS